MSKFIYNKEYFGVKRYRLFQEAYGEHARLQDMCEWKFLHGKTNDCDVANKYGKPQKFWR